MTRVGGTWKPAKQMWTKVAGTWKKVFDLEIADPFDGSGSLDGQFTPGSAKWKVYSGSFTKGSGNATAGALNSVAGIETGTSENIELEIDPANANESGTGVAFWIQDQSNWWGAQSFYQAYSFTNAPTSGTNNFVCSSQFFNAAPAKNADTTVTNHNFTQNSTVLSNGKNYQTGTKRCNTGNWGTFSETGSGCISSCTEFGPVSGTSCQPNGSFANVRNCGNACNNCANTTFPTNTGSGSGCPTSSATSNSVCSSTGLLLTFTSYSCTTNTVPGTFIGCTHTPASSTGQFATNLTSFDGRGNTEPCLGTTLRTCSPSVQFFTIPGTTVNSTFRQTKLVRSFAGTVSDIPGTVNNIGDANTIGGMAVQLYSNQVIVRSYSGAGKSGTAYPSQTYSIGPGTAKGTKHGIVVSGVPTGQGYNISRFKATLI